MPAFSMTDSFNIRVKGTSESRSRTRLSARKHEFLIDEPEARLGTDQGPTPLETMLASFLACTNVIAHMCADDLGIEIGRLDLSLAGEFDTRGSFGKADVTVPFPTIELNVGIETTANEKQIEQMKSSLARRCPVSVILRQAGTTIIENWSVTRP